MIGVARFGKTWLLGLLLLQRPNVDFYPWEIVYSWQVIIQVSQTKVRCWHRCCCCLSATSLMCERLRNFQGNSLNGDVAFEDELQWFGPNAGGRFTVKIWVTLSALNTQTHTAAPGTKSNWLLSQMTRLGQFQHKNKIWKTTKQKQNKRDIGQTAIFSTKWLN